MEALRKGAPWLAWAGALGLALTLPGRPWKAPAAPPFPVHALPPTLGALGLLALLALLGSAALGPRLARARGLALLEAPPDFLWGGLLLASWPASWGPPGWGAWTLGLLLSALPSELRWLAQALPAERPFPAAWGRAAVRRWRAAALRRSLGPWLAARLPQWITAGVVLDRLLSLQGPGSDWLARVEARDRAGLALWVAVLALLWALGRTAAPEEAP